MQVIDEVLLLVTFTYRDVVPAARGKPPARSLAPGSRRTEGKPRRRVEGTRAARGRRTRARSRRRTPAARGRRTRGRSRRRACRARRPWLLALADRVSEQ